MKNCAKKLFALFAAAASFATLHGAVPLEWSPDNPTSLHYEFEVDRKKISAISGLPLNHGYKVTAETADGKTELPTEILQGREENKVLVRFKVPNGTAALSCTPVDNAQEIVDSSVCGNIFSGALQDPAKWKLNNRAAVSKKEDGLLFEAVNFGTFDAKYTTAVPEDLRGKPIRFTMQLKSSSAMVWRNYIYIRQLDKNGKVIHTCAVDPRKISHLRPSETLTRYVETGFIHPEAAELVFTIVCASADSKFDSYGMPLKDKKALLPKLLVSELTMREAHTIVFPRYRDKYFADGVSGKPGDSSLVLGGNSCFSFVSGGQALWAEAVQLRDEKDLFYPAGDGTVECYFKADSWSKRSNILLEAANSINYVKNRYHKMRGILFQLSYLPTTKKITLQLKDAKDRQFNKSVTAPLEVGKWYHLAAQWSQKNGVKLFVNGKLVLEDTNYRYAPIDLVNSEFPNILGCHQFTVGTTIKSARYWPHWGQIKHPDFNGKIDLLRISSGERYQSSFTPATSFEMDSSTRALFDFNRSFNGKTRGNVGYIDGISRSFESRQEKKISYNGKMVQYTPEKVLPEADQDKVLCRLNYPEVPTKNDFLASRTEKCEKVTLSPGAKHTVTLDDDVKMQYIKFVNNGKAKIKYPIIIRKGEVDPRSFGDIADSLELDKLPPRERAYKIFNFLLGASDYFINYQAEFFPGNKNPKNATSLALLMLNSYCGFECGPLNNLTALIFSCSGKLVSSQTAGYGHTFEQVFYDGKNRLYDLSSQRFYPAFDNEGAASLYEAEAEPGILARTGVSADHFVRLSTRGHFVNNIDYLEKAGVTVNPGESYQVFFANNGCYNNLHISNAGHKRAQGIKEYNKLLGLNSKMSVIKVDRPFPHYANSFLTFDANPSKHPAAFRKLKADSFEYAVSTGYPLVDFICSAELEDGTFAAVEFSGDNGKNFKELKQNADGSYHLDYEIMGHHAPVFRIKSNIKKVKHLFARSAVMTNPRVLTGKLVKGENLLTYKAVGNSKCDITICYSKKSAPLEVSGVVCSGGIPGYERLLFAAEPGKSVKLNVKGVSASAKASCTGNLSATLKNGVLTVTVPENKAPSFEQVTISDKGRQKHITAIIARGVKLLTAKDATLSNGAKRISDIKEIQEYIHFDRLKAKALFKVDLPAGNYQIWNCNRFASHAVLKFGDGLLELTAPGVKEEIAHLRNNGGDLFKAEFGKPGERSRCKWDYPYTRNTSYPFNNPASLALKKSDSLEVSMSRKVDGGIDLAALLIVPDDGKGFATEMVKVLCGLNYDKWNISRQLDKENK